LEEFVEFVESVIGCWDCIKIFTIGNVIILAKSEEDIDEVLYAISLPPSIGIGKIRELKESYTCLTKVRDRFIEIWVVDLKSYSKALSITNRIAVELEKYMPFQIESVDLVSSYRASEDGGIFVKHSIVIRVKREYRDLVTKILNILKCSEVTT